MEKTKFRSASRVGLSNSEERKKPRFVSIYKSWFGWASEERKPKDKDSCSELLKNENPKIKIHLGGLPKNENPKVQVDFRRTEKGEPLRFDNMTILNPLRFFKRILSEYKMSNNNNNKKNNKKNNKQKQQRFQEETPDEGSNRQRGRTEEENQQEMLSEMKKQYGNIRILQKFVLVVKDDQGNEKVIDDEDTNLKAENLKLKKQIDEVQVENARLQRENNQLFDKNPDGSRTTSKTLKRIKTKKSERYEEESEEEGSGSNNNDKYDEKEARYINFICLIQLFKIAKKIRRMKAAKRLYSFDDERITKYDKRRLLKMLSNRLFHSPEISETDEEDPTKSIIAIYDYSWRSDESKLIRERRYDDEVQKYDRPHPSNAPEWSYIVQQQDLIFDTDIDQGLITEYDEEEEEVSRGTTPATGNTTENDEDHNKEGEEKPSKSTVGDNHNNSDSDLHMDDAQ
ncbi:hypothetical protein RhiirC2_856802 [Rhizophagus irregularis]|uniref:Uncharacterized protein n=1 Tax=Rhizophagus irregularis TaxID=588596 RepID=A0A2N1MFW2_9GLOM|nr:hypothetical protein RhiirC2_856802 [Rhizophagus irregularis]